MAPFREGTVAESLDILIVAGEASGDAHAGGLMRELRARVPQARFFGMGGKAMRAEGLDALFDAGEISVMGFAEVAPKFFRILGVLKSLARAAAERRPALAILVDVPDFNLRLAKRLKRLGIPVVYFISPMVWAWRSGRVKQIAERVDRMLCILPFEVDFYEKHGVRAEYVGNPVLDTSPVPRPASEYRAVLGIAPDGPLLALLPGSRQSELARVLPTLVASAALLKAKHPELKVVVPVAPSLERAQVRAHFEGSGLEPILIDGRAAEVMGSCDAAVVCSGTATLEAALMLRPFVVVYRASAITMALWRAFMKVEHVSLANLLAGRAVVPELLQKYFTAERVAEAVDAVLVPGAARDEMIAGLASVRERLGAPGASARAAEAVAAFIAALPAPEATPAPALEP